jgi:hypothetical protein
VKFLFTGDWHLDWTTGGLERFDEISEAVEQTIVSAVSEKVDLYVFLGDLCDPDVDSPLTIRAIARSVEVARTLEKEGIQSVWITGNHDVIEDGRGSHTLLALARAGFEVHATRPYGALLPGGIGLLFLPYAPLSHRYDPAQFVRSCGLMAATRFVVAGHATRIRGYDLGSEETDMARGRAMEFPIDEALALGPEVLLANGHYHSRYHDPVWTPGSLARLTHGEERHEPGWLVMEL